MKGQVGFGTIVKMIWTLIMLSGMIAAYYLIFAQFISSLDPLSKFFGIVIGVTMVAGIIFIGLNEAQLTGGGRGV